MAKYDLTQDSLIADPGNGKAIRVDRSGVVPIVTAGAETRTIGRPKRVGLRLCLYMKTDGGDCVVTVTGNVNATGNNTITMGDAGDRIILEAIHNGTALIWQSVLNDGCALSTV